MTIEAPNGGTRQRRPRLGDPLVARRQGPVDPELLPPDVRADLEARQAAAESREQRFAERRRRYLKTVTAACAIAFGLASAALLPFGLYGSIGQGLLSVGVSIGLGALVGWRLVEDGGGRARGAIYAGGAMLVSMVCMLTAGGLAENATAAVFYFMGLLGLAASVGSLSGMFVHWRKFDQQI